MGPYRSMQGGFSQPSQWGSFHNQYPQSQPNMGQQNFQQQPLSPPIPEYSQTMMEAPPIEGPPPVTAPSYGPGNPMQNQPFGGFQPPMQSQWGGQQPYAKGGQQPQAKGGQGMNSYRGDYPSFSGRFRGN